MVRIFKMATALWPFYVVFAMVAALVWALSRPAPTIGPMLQEQPQPPLKSKLDKNKAERTDKIVHAIAGAMTIKKTCRNPDSFKLEQAELMDNGSACYVFRSQNGFGGMNRVHAVLYGGANIKTSEMEGFSGEWNKYCARKSGEDVLDYLERAMK